MDTMKITRLSPYIFTVCVALVAITSGCVRKTTTTRTINGENPNGKQEQLAPAEAARACIAVAEQFEASGHDQEALRQYQIALIHQPKLKGITHRMALIYDRQGLDNKALETYPKAIAEEPQRSDILNDFGYYYYRRGEWTQAEAMFRKTVIQDPSNKRAWVNLGMSLAQLNRPEESLSAFSQAVNDAQAFSNVGVILAQAGNREEAKYYLRQALDREPTLPQTKAVLAWLEGGGTKPEGM
jgi:Tfp pilus assembly protein PilF